MLKRALKFAALAIATYVVLVNLALQLPVTQTLINAIRPEKFNVAWDNAWTLIPVRVHASGVSANGQSRSQQWQLHATSASASINPLPLILKRVWLSGVSVENIDYRQRPRLKAERDYRDLIPYFPEIQGRQIVPADSSPRKKKRPWRLAIDGIEASGEHRYWVMQFKGAGSGTLRADMTFQTRGGPFSLKNGQAELTLEPLYVRSDKEIFNHGTVSGTVAFEPFVPRQNKGAAMLKFLTTDAVVDFDVNSLAFLDLLTRNFKQMKSNGQGKVAGRLSINQGVLQTDTNLNIAATDLLIEVIGHRIAGQGAIAIGESPDIPGWLDLGVRFTNPTVTHVGDGQPLLQGETLALSLTGSGDLTGESDRSDNRRSLMFQIDDLLAPDLALFEHYLPGKWPLKLYGGEGRVNGFARIAPSAVAIDLSLKSSGANLGAGDYRFTSNLESTLKLDNPAIATNETQMGGTYIRLYNSRLSDEDDNAEGAWEASFAINSGSLSLLPDDQKRSEDTLRDLLQAMGDADSKSLLENMRGYVDFESHVSSLAWINVLLDGSQGTKLSGRGEVAGTLRLAEGMPAAGTDIEVLSDELGLDILDYHGEGDGRISLAVRDGNNSPDWLLDIELANGTMKRLGEEIAYVEDVNLSLAALIENVSLARKSGERTLALNVASARVTDLSAFNSYLPSDGPLHLTAGTASLSSNLVLQPEDADGWLKLDSNDLEFALDGQSLRADLALDLKVVDGVPRDMMFDVSGSSLGLSRVRVTGDKTVFDGEDWSADFQLTQAQTTWRKPLMLDARADLKIADSRPVVALLNNRGDSPGWLLKMITIEDIEGKAAVEIADNRIIIPLAHAISDKIEVGAKANITTQTRNGMIYARYKKLDAVMKVKDGNRNIDLIRAREKYDKYAPAQVIQGK